MQPSDCDPLSLSLLNPTRRHFLSQATMGVGAMTLSRLLPDAFAGGQAAGPAATAGVLGKPHFTPRAKRIIYLFQSGGPSQLDLFDYKPLLHQRNGEELPDEIRKGQRLTGMSSNQSTIPLAGAQFEFERHGQCRAWVSELLPYTSQIVDELCFVRSLHTEAINHDPAITFFQSGSQNAGRPSFGSWLSYGLGSMNRNLPEFIVLLSKDKGGQPLCARLWGSGFLPSKASRRADSRGKRPGALPDQSRRRHAA